VARLTDKPLRGKGSFPARKEKERSVWSSSKKNSDDHANARRAFFAACTWRL